MSDPCYITPPNTMFLMNVFIHVMILLSIVSGFYFLFVSHLSKDVFRKQLKKLISKNFKKLLEHIDRKEDIKKILSPIDLDKYINYYENKTGRDFEVQNWWLKAMTVTVICALVLILIVFAFVLVKSCNHCPPFGELITENIVVFTFVGAIEILFFLFIAKNFVPVKPSLMVTSLIKDIREVVDRKLSE